ncbi:thioredoxin domain-containing protein [Penicillium taxi]|uniref:thioredoxin domain-containing protein n=1 Tax=Penicillium taxi TaxID=168475 RepID=UPI002545653E|nr:thioredoxin domain-containing protein [Penicillium taxi]KAJ5893570.1 thioredoxin domain-containing protein [Penicillium taxi]
MPRPIIKQFEDIISANKTVAAEFTARWCDECKSITPVFRKLSDQYPSITFVRIDVEKVGLLAQKYSVSYVPTFLFFKNGKKGDQLQGYSKRALEKKVSELAA